MSVRDPSRMMLAKRRICHTAEAGEGMYMYGGHVRCCLLAFSILLACP